MHSVNVVFLLGDTALNCLVSFHTFIDTKCGLRRFDVVTDSHCYAISAVSLVSNWILLSVDRSLCYFPVGCSCLHFNLVMIMLILICCYLFTCLID